jgi:hypothetical protein
MNKWDLPAQLATNKDVLVLGAPGTGYESLFASAAKSKRSKFRHRLLGDCGFRSSSLHPHQWIVDTNKLFYEMTSSHSRQTIWYGCADNIESILFLPWLDVYFLSIDDDEYINRINMYRAAPPISMQPNLELNRTLLAIKHRLDYLRDSGSKFFRNTKFKSIDFDGNNEKIFSSLESRIKTVKWTFLYDKQLLTEQVAVVEDDIISVDIDPEGAVSDVHEGDVDEDDSLTFLNH